MSVVGYGCQLKEAFPYQANTQGETEHEQRKEETRGFHIHCESGEGNIYCEYVFR